MEPNSLGGGMLLNIGFWDGSATPKTKPPILFYFLFYFLFFYFFVSFSLLGVAWPPSPIMGGGSSHPLGQNGVVGHPTPFLFF
jgi:prepilin-type processing-associated H-X9-DG protein